MQANLEEFLKKLHHLQKVSMRIQISGVLSNVEFVFLNIIKELRLEEESKEGIRASTISRHMMTSPSSVSKLLNVLEVEGYVQRSIDPQDRRSICVNLTPYGEEKLLLAEQDYNAFLETILNSLGEDAEKLLGIIDKINALLSNRNET